MPYKDVARQLANKFKARFSLEATHYAAAPGRVNFIGEHLDYNEGLVLPLAIDRHVVFAGALNEVSNQVEIYSEEVDETLCVALDGEIEVAESGWKNYVIGVIAELRKQGFKIPACKAQIFSTLPLGGGLSSSAALEVAAAKFFESLTGETMSGWDKVKLCQRAENQYAGVPCGIMDQFSSVFGKQDSMMLLDCRDTKFEYVPFDDESLSVLVTNTQVKHQLMDGEYSKRKEQCREACEVLEVASLRDVSVEQLERNRMKLGPILFRRAKHVVSEIQRTIDCANAVASHQWELVGNLMFESHQSLKNDYEVSCRELDLLVEFFRELSSSHAIYGARMTGGGFGGSTVALLKTSAVAETSQMIAKMYRDETKLQPTIFSTRPVDGASAFAI